MNETWCAWAALLALAWNAPAPADIPAPPPAPKTESRFVVPVEIVSEPRGQEGRSVQAKIVIPMSLLRGGPGNPAPIPAGLPAPPAPGGEASLVTPPLGSVVAGLCMSLAAVSLVFVVRGSRFSKTVALVMLTGAAVASGYGIASADITPGRPSNRPQYPPAPPGRAPNEPIPDSQFRAKQKPAEIVPKVAPKVEKSKVAPVPVRAGDLGLDNQDVVIEFTNHGDKVRISLMPPK